MALIMINRYEHKNTCGQSYQYYGPEVYINTFQIEAFTPESYYDDASFTAVPVYRVEMASGKEFYVNQHDYDLLIKHMPPVIS